jgi:hypothetical protein
MTSIPFILTPLKGFLKIFIYLNELRQRYGRGRIKGIKGIEALTLFYQHTLIPLIPFILSGGCGWCGSAIDEKGGLL